ncbi:MAG: outer membrane protein assembly factor BamA precursor, partial [Pseudomonadota bacterium]
MSKALVSVLRPAVFAVLVGVSAASWAADPFRIRDIRVEGLQRVEAGTVFATLPFRSGDDYSDDKGTSAIRALFGLGLFQDVRVEIDGDVVIIAVQERPSVADIQFTGLKEFDQEMIRKALKDLGLAEGRPFDRALADRAEQEIKRQYLNRAMYATQVVTTITPVEKNQVKVNMTVTEGSVAKIRELRVVGVQAFKLSNILDLMEQNTGNWLSWYTKSDRYSQAKLNADLEAIKSFYLNQGYVEFRIDSTQVAISPDKADVSITINLFEGQRFAVSGVKLVGEFLGRESDFQPLVQVKPGRAYNVDDVTATVQLFKDRFAEYGYAFARVEAQPRVDRQLGTVEMVFQANPQQRVYVRRIEIEGNDRTRDEVIRREFRQMESAWYDGKLIKLSRDRVDRLGYFTEVAVQPKEVPSHPDQVDLVLKVVERPTGNLSIGAGYSQAEKLS